MNSHFNNFSVDNDIVDNDIVDNDVVDNDVVDNDVVDNDVVDNDGVDNALMGTDDEIKEYRRQRRKMLIPKILGKLQQQTSKQINIIGNTIGSKNWQKDYHDHIIRNDESYHRISNYIINNPKKWDEDKFYQ